MTRDITVECLGVITIFIGITAICVSIYKDYTDYKFFKACKDGNKTLVLSLIEKGANDWNYGLRGACQGGQKDLVLLMISMGANDWSLGLYGACQGGHTELALFMIEKRANVEEGLRGACKGGHKDLALLMIGMGANDFYGGKCYAVRGGHKDLELLMIEKGASIYDSHLTIDDILYLMKRGLKNFDRYEHVAQYWREWEIITRIGLSDLMIPELIDIVAS